ncbi:MAG: HD family hydrolase [Candidatus Thorarchaeota archaeon]
MKAEEIIELAMKAEVLKDLDRTGWVLAGVDRSLIESVAEHSFGTSFISLLLAKQLEGQGDEIDLGKILTMAIIHDLAESQISDIAIDRDGPNRKALLKAKLDTENSVMVDLLSSLGAMGEELLALWDDFQKQSSIEARVVASADILDMLVHAIALEESCVSPRILTDFFKSSKPRLEKLKFALAIDIFNALLRQHEENIKDEA